MILAMPQSLKELSEIVGLSDGAIQSLVAEYGGVSLYVPKNVAGHRLAALIGEDDAVKLSGYYGGEAINIPLCSESRRVARNRGIIRDSANMSAAELARKYGMSARSVKKILAEARERGEA